MRPRSRYSYVGPQEIAQRSPAVPAGFRIESPDDVRTWVRETGQDLTPSRSVIATFVIDESGTLRIADRRSEHVACAGGAPVLSAGEMTFAVLPNMIRVTWVTNQSAGYGPEPESWPAVRDALSQAGIAAPPGWDQEIIFRRCSRCDAISIVKDGVFDCELCSAPLSATWNLDAVRDGPSHPSLSQQN